LWDYPCKEKSSHFITLCLVYFMLHLWKRRFLKLILGSSSFSKILFDLCYRKFLFFLILILFML
jgi:hypothetical protein